MDVVEGDVPDLVVPVGEHLNAPVAAMAAAIALGADLLWLTLVP